MKETTYNKIPGGHVLIIILGITVLAFLMLASVAGAVPFAYITNYDDNTTSVIDIATNTVTSTVPVAFALVELRSVRMELRYMWLTMTAIISL